MVSAFFMKKILFYIVSFFVPLFSLGQEEITLDANSGGTSYIKNLNWYKIEMIQLNSLNEEKKFHINFKRKYYVDNKLIDTLDHFSLAPLFEKAENIDQYVKDPLLLIGYDSLDWYNYVDTARKKLLKSNPFEVIDSLQDEYIAYLKNYNETTKNKIRFSIVSGPKYGFKCMFNQINFYSKKFIFQYNFHHTFKTYNGIFDRSGLSIDDIQSFLLQQYLAKTMDPHIKNYSLKVLPTFNISDVKFDFDENFVFLQSTQHQFVQKKIPELYNAVQKDFVIDKIQYKQNAWFDFRVKKSDTSKVVYHFSATTIKGYQNFLKKFEEVPLEHKMVQYIQEKDSASVHFYFSGRSWHSNFKYNRLINDLERFEKIEPLSKKELKNLKKGFYIETHIWNKGHLDMCNWIIGEDFQYLLGLKSHGSTVLGKKYKWGSYPHHMFYEF